VVALFPPWGRSYSYSVGPNRPLTTVYDTLNGFSRFKDWNPIVRYDKQMHIEVTGPAMGKGAKFSYSSREPTVGSGSWEIVDSTPEKIRYRLTGPTRGADKTMTIELSRAGPHNRNDQITQIYRVKHGREPVGRETGLCVDPHRGAQHPGEFSFVDMPAQDVLVVSTAAQRTNDEIQVQMRNQMAWNDKVMASNGLVADGPVRIVTTEFTSQTYAFDVVQPVRKADAPEGQPAGEKMILQMEGPVSYEQTPARHLAMTTYTGPAPGLARVRDVLRAWAMTHGNDTDDRPFEEYVGGIDSMVADDAQFKVYWPIKK